MVVSVRKSADLLQGARPDRLAWKYVWALVGFGLTGTDWQHSQCLHLAKGVGSSGGILFITFLHSCPCMPLTSRSETLCGVLETINVSLHLHCVSMRGISHYRPAHVAPTWEVLQDYQQDWSANTFWTTANFIFLRVFLKKCFSIQYVGQLLFKIHPI